MRARCPLDARHQAFGGCARGARRPHLSARSRPGLYTQGRTRARERGIDERWGIYAAQIALMMQEEPDREARVAEHVSKAMRESRMRPATKTPMRARRSGAGSPPLDLTGALDSDAIWSVEDGGTFAQIRDRLILAQVALQLTAPGIPDIYQGTEISCVRPERSGQSPPCRLGAVSDPPTERDARKLALTRELIALRRDHAEHLAMGSYEIDVSDDYWTVRPSMERQANRRRDRASPRRRFSGRGNHVIGWRPRAHVLCAMDDDHLGRNGVDITPSPPGMADLGAEVPAVSFGKQPRSGHLDAESEPGPWRMVV